MRSCVRRPAEKTTISKSEGGGGNGTRARCLPGAIAAEMPVRAKVAAASEAGGEREPKRRLASSQLGRARGDGVLETQPSAARINVPLDRAGEHADVGGEHVVGIAPEAVDD